MKLKLEALRDISILQVAGPVTPENFAILKAGIKKLFTTGKNKIILELPDSGTFPTPVLRELAVLNLLASELSGQILLAAISPLTRAKIEAFSKPPVVRCFADRVKAMEFFYPKGAEEIPTQTPAVSAPSPSVAAPVPAAPAPVAPNFALPTEPSVVSVAPAGTTTAAAGSSEDQQKYKKEIRSKEMGDLGETRKKLSELEAENKELKTRLAELMIVRRDPPDIDAWKEKTAKLEKSLADAIKMAQDALAAKK